MSFHNTAACFLTFYRSDQFLLIFKFKIFVLYIIVCLLFMLHLVVGKIMYGYNMVEHSVTGTNNCIGTNYCKLLI